MRIAVMSWSFNSALRAGEMDTADVIRFVRGLGVEAVELMDGFITDDQEDGIARALADTGCAHVCYDVGGDFVQADLAGRQAAVEEVVAGLERGARLGAQRALVKQCLPAAARLGLPLTIEDHSSQAAVYGRSEHLEHICGGVGPRLQVTYDVGNFLLAGEDPASAAIRLGSRIVHAHYKDWHALKPGDEQPARGVTSPDGARYTGAVLGEGVVDMVAATAALRRIGYQGYVSVEYEGVGDPREAVRRGVAYARTLLDRAA
jgi:sugar phosphate isomerase/epimerase